MNMPLTGVSLDELVALTLRSLRQAPTGLAALLSATTEALDARLVAVSLVPASGRPETLGAAGPDGPGLSQRTGEDDAMLRSLSRQMEPAPVHPDLRAGAWVDHEHVWSVTSCIDEETSCVVIAAGDHPMDPEELLRASAPMTVLAFIISQDRNSKDLRHHAVEADQQRSLLLAGLHHDLRTPLTGIVGSARTLIQRNEQLAPAVRREFLDSIVRQADRLTRMVADTLDRGNDRDGPVRQSKVRVTDLCERAVAAARMSRGGSISVEAPDEEICTDGDRVERVLLNLLDNALKYSPEGSSVYLIAESLEGRARFTVADQGPGVAHDVLPRLFSPYVSDSGRSDGTGLGLNSAKQVVEEDLSGRLSYSRHEGWTRFVMDVPVEVEA